ncbi:MULTISPECIES: ParB/RepB/Spo0J family partition protein [Synechocystis]|uniref:Plasmid partitioning protein n=1 Tax=Synechocystis salina LEGE 00031 TaxID=1828736 RepID=A0ABR9VUU8_9SYNC|nr:MULTISPECIES: ParB N-terminal domain-containing protein [Synechocystis]MBD2655520.1 plasmid partitioning protein [Synechocystis sp. FACHB-383]MBE9241216.1 plasmid partitioning protein [Synechocystis salina LEGE 00041]MBE9255117.1 plasmid partitioning protein [Synechocystis salina LEGE 00031]
MSRKSTLSLGKLDQRADEEFVPTNAEDSTTIKLLALEQILDRPGGDTRLLKQKHVDDLAESISFIGLITPLAVDSQNHLLAGAHRRAALQKIEEEDPNLYKELFPAGVPVKVFDFEASENSLEALQIEIEENSQRRNFTPTEIKKAAQRLEEAGYKSLKGRPRKGQKSLKRELAKVFGLSEDRIQRLLNDSVQKGRCTPTFSPGIAIVTLEKWSSQIDASGAEALVGVAKQITDLLEELRKLDPE